MRKHGSMYVSVLCNYPCSPGCAIDLSAIAQELPNKYKVPAKNSCCLCTNTHTCNRIQ